ncbi:MAG: hypothetical protein A3G18_07935 [Rhodospirillales bacterium RIFCSPLOWO2_12_FULL_58_28]|nr:MAG: hypothetical protein A3H92_05895 [Rhodospirillales bacterium RIFCSPLOWO2_02_FULL_58_16]OHC78375.1 MAG: hypothetical protein A3G18_07935 [Rhodospirillales bacterium RIFCSPLOWO2_12_FULL_58_28]
MGQELPRVIGHRGASGHAPENTTASMVKAAKLGVTWVEFDARLSRDGQVVIFHDDSLERTSDGSGPVANADLAQLQLLDAGSWYAKEFAGEPIPTLSRMLKELAALGLCANVEIKSDKGREDETGRAVAALLDREWPSALPTPLISSFNPQALAAAAATASHIPRALCIDNIPKDWRRRLEAYGADAVHCRHDKLRPDRARAVIDAGFAVRCYTVNQAEQAEALFRHGVQSVFSDYPDRF